MNDNPTGIKAKSPPTCTYGMSIRKSEATVAHKIWWVA